MNHRMENLPGHAYAPGFEPSGWDKFASWFFSSLSTELIAGLVVAGCLAVVMASRLSTRQDRRRRRTPILPEFNVPLQGGSSLKPRERKRKGTRAEQLDERAKYFWDA